MSLLIKIIDWYLLFIREAANFVKVFIKECLFEGSVLWCKYNNTVVPQNYDPPIKQVHIKLYDFFVFQDLERVLKVMRARLAVNKYMAEYRKQRDIQEAVDKAKACQIELTTLRRKLARTNYYKNRFAIFISFGWIHYKGTHGGKKEMGGRKWREDRGWQQHFIKRLSVW